MELMRLSKRMAELGLCSRRESRSERCTMPSTSPSRPDEQTKFGLVLDLALDRGSDWIFLGEGFPRILQGLLETERDAALGGIDLEHLNLDFLAGRDDLARMDVLLGPGHFGDVDQALDSRLQLDERAHSR